ncbi:MAG: HDIG domain-containing protein [Deltaproteobacteria bacterium]|jgi:putative nucleotidyltransferase with HDIG domain|nr:HDIG domain-containing protein [Deltaproteobacteria bacterium]
MANNKIILPGEKTSKIRKILDLSVRLHLGKGLFGLVVVLAALSFLASYEWKPAPRAYTAGEIATSDIASPFAFRFQDLEATSARKEAVRRAQPLICVLDVEPVDRMQRNVHTLFTSVGKTIGAANRVKLRQNLSEETGEDFSERMFNTLMDPAVQNLVNNDVMPWLEKRLREGVLSESRILADYSGGIVVRDGSGAAADTSLTEISDVAAVRVDLRAYLNGISANRLVNRVVLAILTIHIMPTLRPDFEATAKSANEAVRTVRPVMQPVMAGEVIVRQGERISPAQLPKLHALLSHESESFHFDYFLGVLICSLLLCGGLFISPTGRKLESIGQPGLLFIAFLVGFSALLAKALYLLGAMLAAYTPGFAGTEQVFAVPVAGLAALVCTVFSIRRYHVINVLLALFCTLISKGGLPLFIFYFISAMFGSWFTAEIQTRKEVIRSFFPLLAALIPLWLGASLVMGGEPGRFLTEFPALLLGVILSLFLFLALPPLIEMLFGFTTRFSLMELMNQEHPVLRKLMFNAPGTYQHSLVVANMSEIAAEAIGAHSLLCKVGALYHDIGKVDMPHYFVENQSRGENPHDRLTPAMSALVLISHVKRGVELATRYRLGREITDIVREHHGNRVIQYFYQKALALQETAPEGGPAGPPASSSASPVSKEDFCYGGPRPQTRESALIMLADVVEASSRTLADPTPSRIRSHVHNMIRGVLADGQLDSVDMTFRDLELVEDNFTMILTGMFHKRIEYPWQKKALPKGELPPPLPLGLPAQPMAYAREAVGGPAAPAEAPPAATGANGANGSGGRPRRQQESLSKWLAN